MKNYSNYLLLFLLVLGIFIASCGDGATEATVKEPHSNGENKTDNKPQVKKEASNNNEINNQNNSSYIDDVEKNILDIRERFQDTENNLKSFSKKIAEMKDSDGFITDLTGYYDQDGKSRKVVVQEVMGHGASTVSYYIKNGTIYFIYEERVSEASVMGPFTFNERRTYVKDEKIIRLLEKEETVKMDEKPQLSKVPNKDITATLKDQTGKVNFDGMDNILQLLAGGDAAK
ncbi:MAG: hypothetical protein AB8F94_07875 [Saprospiraceae bacterium]